MKKYVSLWAIAALIVIGTAATPPLLAEEKDWTLVGTWINPVYDGGSVDKLPKVVLTSDGAISQYYHVEGSLAWSVGTYVIESDWTEPGVHWFKVRSAYSVWTFFELAKLTNDGNTYESVFSSQTYPSGFITSGDGYRIRNRQN
jgi:hypothetical protein